MTSPIPQYSVLLSPVLKKTLFIRHFSCVVCRLTCFLKCSSYLVAWCFWKHYLFQITSYEKPHIMSYLHAKWSCSMQLWVSIHVTEVFLYCDIVKPNYKFMIWFINVLLLKLLCFVSVQENKLEKQQEREASFLKSGEVYVYNNSSGACVVLVLVGLLG